MRRLAVLMTMMVVAQGAQAADLPDFLGAPLRGSFREEPAGHVNWEGFYVGGQYGIASTNFNLGSAASGLSTLSQTVVGAVPSVSTLTGYNKTTTNPWGGFVGYNWQFEDAVVGFDINYNKGGQSASAVVIPTTLTQVISGSTYVTTTTGVGSMNITDYGSLRVRGGWAIDRFMPYGTFGLAFGRADLARSITTVGTVDNGGGGGPVPYGPVTATQNKNGAFLYGYSFGAGFDMSLIGGLFLRAEVERTRFTQTWGMDATVTAARAGAGYRF